MYALTHIFLFIKRRILSNIQIKSRSLCPNSQYFKSLKNNRLGVTVVSMVAKKVTAIGEALMRAKHGVKAVVQATVILMAVTGLIFSFSVF